MPEQYDPRLADPDQYFRKRYGSVVVSYGDHKFPLNTMLDFENLARPPESIANDSKERRANVFINMLREAGALEPADDVVYPETTE